MMHVAEERKSSNTARPLHLALTNSKLFCHGKFGEITKFEQHIKKDGSTFLLYPDASAIELDQEFIKTLTGPIKLVVPDGSWQQARKMTHSISDIAVLPRLRLRPQALSSYTLRRAPRNAELNDSIRREMLCTIESVAEALGILEGADIKQQLLKLLNELNARVQWSKLRADPYNLSFAKGSVL